MSAVVILIILQCSGALRVLPAGSWCRKQNVSCALLLLGLKPDDLPSLGIWRKLYSRMITGQQTARACPARKSRQPPNVSQGSRYGSRDYWTGGAQGTLRLAQSHGQPQPGQVSPGQVKGLVTQQ